jgi:hypothetical protein
MLVNHRRCARRIVGTLPRGFPALKPAISPSPSCGPTQRTAATGPTHHRGARFRQDRYARPQSPINGNPISSRRSHRALAQLRRERSDGSVVRRSLSSTVVSGSISSIFGTTSPQTLPILSRNVTGDFTPKNMPARAGCALASSTFGRLRRTRRNSAASRRPPWPCPCLY